MRRRIGATYFKDLNAMDRMGETEQAEWLAFDFALAGNLPKKPVDPDEKPPENMTPHERLQWVLDRQ
jgi:hypothetical protein